MKKLIITGIMPILSAALLLPVAGCDGETGETEPVASESNRWLVMLQIMPENEDTLTAAAIQTEGYVDIIREEYGEKLGEDPVSPELIAHNNIPLFAKTQYTDEEYKMTRGWGHSTYNSALLLAMEAGVKKFCIFHHDPDRTDDDLDRQLEYCHNLIYKAGSSVRCFASEEGMQIEI